MAINGPEVFPLTRVSALDRLVEFAPTSGSKYSKNRNLDLGPGQHRHVSRLSAALRRRVIGEEEVLDAILAHQELASLEKFVSEVFWRGYWKGWLEQRPTLWKSYLSAVARSEASLLIDQDLRQRYVDARSGTTGIDCFDGWVRELEATRYLHNWARMQFASIWIFTLGLPWELGAAYTLSRFIDADPASNTLSWRWVAGLHTQGKAYLADPARISVMTGGRFSPRGLAQRAFIPSETVSVPQPGDWRGAQVPRPDVSSLLVVSVEDLSLETRPAIAQLPVLVLAVLASDNVVDKLALEDALARAGRMWPSAQYLGAISPAGLRQAAALGCRQVVTGFACVGPTADRLVVLAQQAEEHGLSFTESIRDWDLGVWPHCRKGFFGLKAQIPALVDRFSSSRLQGRLV